MKFYHAMIRVKNLEESISFWTKIMDFEVTRKNEYEDGRFTLVFLKSKSSEFIIELTYNWDESEDYPVGRNFGHFAFLVEDIYEFCNKLVKNNIIINRPPRDGRMAFFKDPNNISIELLQEGDSLALQEPWKTMGNQGTW